MYEYNVIVWQLKFFAIYFPVKKMVIFGKKWSIARNKKRAISIWKKDFYSRLNERKKMQYLLFGVCSFY